VISMTDIPLATAEAVVAESARGNRRTAPFVNLPGGSARIATLAGAVVTIASTFMSWT